MSYEWITPKTDWVKTDQFTYQDYNRIRNNLLYLNEQINVNYPNLSEELDLGEEKTGYANDYYPSEFEAFEDALESFKRIGINVNIGERINYKGNSSFIDFASLNRIEKNCLNWKPNINIKFTVETRMTPAPDYTGNNHYGYFPDKEITLLYTINPTPPSGYQVRVYANSAIDPDEVDLLEEQYTQGEGKIVIKFKNRQGLVDGYYIFYDISIRNPEGRLVYSKYDLFGMVIRINNFKMPRHFSHSAYWIGGDTIYGGDFTNDSLELNTSNDAKNAPMFKMKTPAPVSLKNRVAGKMEVLEFGENGKDYLVDAYWDNTWEVKHRSDSDKNIKFANNIGVECLPTIQISACYVGGQASTSGESIGRRMIFTDVIEGWSEFGEVINLPNDIGKKNICCTSALIVDRYSYYASRALCYIMGGNSDGVLSKALYRFDEDTKTFEKKKDLPIGIEGGCCYYAKYFSEDATDLFFIVAYGKKGDKWYIYNIRTDAWITGGKLPRDFYGGRIAITRDGSAVPAYSYSRSRIYLVGGNSNAEIDGVTNEITFLAYTSDVAERSRKAV